METSISNASNPPVKASPSPPRCTCDLRKGAILSYSDLCEPCRLAFIELDRAEYAQEIYEDQSWQRWNP